MNQDTTQIIEIFSSFQGEGPHMGERHLFVRLQDCELSCRFCDTPLSFVVNRFCRVEYPPLSKKYIHLNNPVSISDLNQTIARFDDPVISITGGEPLQKTPFLKAWLPTLEHSRQILLETAGVHFSEFRDIIDYIDIVSMDFKLKSSTGMHPWWQEHELFLKAALDKGKEVYIKAVMTRDTTDEDLEKGIRLLMTLDPNIPLILQPASVTQKFQAAPSLEQMYRWHSLTRELLPHVRVIPQMHKHMGIS